MNPGPEHGTTRTSERKRTRELHLPPPSHISTTTDRQHSERGRRRAGEPGPHTDLIPATTDTTTAATDNHHPRPPPPTARHNEREAEKPRRACASAHPHRHQPRHAFQAVPGRARHRIDDRPRGHPRHGCRNPPQPQRAARDAPATTTAPPTRRRKRNHPPVASAPWTSVSLHHCCSASRLVLVRELTIAGQPVESARFGVVANFELLQLLQLLPGPQPCLPPCSGAVWRTPTRWCTTQTVVRYGSGTSRASCPYARTPVRPYARTRP